MTEEQGTHRRLLTYATAAGSVDPALAAAARRSVTGEFNSANCVVFSVLLRPAPVWQGVENWDSSVASTFPFGSPIFWAAVEAAGVRPRTVTVMPVRPLVLWRVLLLGFAVVYVLSGRLQALLPPLLPFLAAAAVEAQFFLAGLRVGRRRWSAPDRGPQQRDLEEFGWASRTMTVPLGEAELVLRPGEMEPEEIAEWLERHRGELAALGPGRHELALIQTPESAPSPYLPPPETPAPRRLQKRLLQALAVLALLAGLFLLDTTAPRWQGLSPPARQATVALLNRQATGIAGHPAEVICDVSGHHVGYVQDADGLAVVGGHQIWLTPKICYQLYLVRHTRRAAGTNSGEAIAVFAHEAWHLQGQTSEAIANCLAYQSGVQVGEALGLPPARARQLMREQLANNPADFAATPQYIVPPGCQRGGSLDIHLDGRHFP